MSWSIRCTSASTTIFPLEAVASVGSPHVPDGEYVPGAPSRRVNRMGVDAGLISLTARFMSTEDGSMNSIMDVFGFLCELNDIIPIIGAGIF